MLLYHDPSASEKYFSYLNAHENSGILEAMKRNIEFLLLCYLIGLNLLAFFACGWDKHLARRHRWRIPERALLALAWLGGAAGMLLAMQLFRHKTQHKRFTILVPLTLFFQLFLLFLFFSRGVL